MKKIVFLGILNILIMIGLVFGISYYVNEVTTEVKKVGLKNIVSEIWEGEKKD